MIERSKYLKDMTPLGIIVEALETDGAHHKQWYLEQLLFALGFNATEIKEKEILRGYDWDEGIAP